MAIQILHVDSGHRLLLECEGKTLEVELGLFPESHPVAGDKLFSVTKKSAVVSAEFLFIRVGGGGIAVHKCDDIG